MDTVRQKSGNYCIHFPMNLRLSNLFPFQNDTSYLNKMTLFILGLIGFVAGIMGIGQIDVRKILLVVLTRILIMHCSNCRKFDPIPQHAIVAKKRRVTSTSYCSIFSLYFFMFILDSNFSLV